jgi:CheY-like chemotaxis protein
MPHFNKVLLIDDDEITVTICDRLMKISDFAANVIACPDGQRATDYLVENVSCLPEIILVDLQMGIMNGWDFLNWFQKWPASLQKCPAVYVLSSSLSHEDVQRSESYGCVKGFIVKPITVEHLNNIATEVAGE